MTLSLEELLTVEELANRLRMSTSALNKWRLLGIGPKYIKTGRLVRYRGSDVTKWLDDQARASTSDVGKAA
jgi:predicted DNA-binding transcriptional regulator AlpA